MLNYFWGNPLPLEHDIVCEQPLTEDRMCNYRELYVWLQGTLYVQGPYEILHFPFVQLQGGMCG